MGSRSESGRVLVTGVRGFTGRYLRDELTRAGFDVCGLVHRAPADLDEIACDLTDADDVARAVGDSRADYVVHLAAVAFAGGGDPSAFYRVNVLGTLNLLQAIEQRLPRVRRVLLASSSNVYGNLTEGALDETLSPKPVNDYGVSKLAMELMAVCRARVLPIVIARPFNYTGVGQEERYLIPKIVAHFAKRSAHIDLGNIDVIRDFSDVRDVVRAYRMLLAAEATGVTVNICSGLGYSIRDVFDLLSRAAGFAPDIRINPDFVRANELKVLIGDRDRLDGLIGGFKRHTLEETLRWMLSAATSDR